MCSLEKAAQQRLEMVNKKKIIRPSLHPLYPILFVSEEKIFEIPAKDLTTEQIGVKAYGLSSLPEAWTLPFIVISSDLLHIYRYSNGEERDILIKKWISQITQALQIRGIQDNDSIKVRSSGCSEGLRERGKLCSIDGTFKNIYLSISECLQKIASDADLNNQQVPLIIQRRVMPLSAKGHLSNERMHAKEARDWIGSYETIDNKSGQHFQINLRNWRKKIIAGNYVDDELKCNISALVAEVLKIPAAWGTQQKIRLHFEWIWDGQRIYIVQADQENESTGINPTKVHINRLSPTHKFSPKCIKIISQKDASQYSKIHNVFTYLKLGLPVAPLYILDDQSIINDIVSGIIAPDLKEDISELIKSPLVIRTDIDTVDISIRQMLPRCEVRTLADALHWMQEKAALIKGKTLLNLAFVFHNFVPAVSSAFAYAAPGERKVMIEALWGLPEGLYYNAHDKYVVDTKKPKCRNLTKSDMSQFDVFQKTRFKRFFISPDINGKWITQILQQPYDWRGSIQNTEWAQEIAFESRRIAEEEQKPLSIMWFVGVPLNICGRSVFPWHHEIYDSRIRSRAQTHRTKTPFDKSLVINTNADIDALRKEIGKETSNVRRIRIQPLEEELLRNKDTLHTIGEIAKKLDANILLEGGILSHAFYQLIQTGAVVEILSPFDELEDKQEFHKLVRDKVSTNIENGGEVVRKTRLSGEFLLKALREKLVEEAFETLDAGDKDSIIGELADVSEVIDGILSLLHVNREELKQKQDKKREKAGGFSQGIVLLETKNPLPAKKEDATLFDGYDLQEKEDYEHISMSDLFELSHKIQKWSDKREHKAAGELILNLLIPIISEHWLANAPEIIIDADSGNVIQAEITGKRLGSKLQLKLSIFTQLKQLKLL